MTTFTLRSPLSRLAAQFLRQHPDKAQRAVVEALEAAAVESQPTAAYSRRSLPEKLRRFVVPQKVRAYETDWLNLTEAAEKLHISRVTLNAWIKANRIISWRLTRYGMIVPGEQILADGKLVPGLDRVLDEIETPLLAWNFLAEESAFLDPPCRPIDALKAGRIDEVVQAARSQGEALT